MRPTNTILFFTLVSLLFANINCKNDEPLQPKTDNPPTVDTTSHNFTWTTYTFAGNYGSSYFKDVAIINDSDIWAVGLIYTSPETTYNAAHWDGKKWELKKIKVLLTYTESEIITDQDPFVSVYSFSSNDIWFVSSAGGVTRFVDGNWIMLSIPYGQGPGGAKTWGTNSNNLYFVTSLGRIVYFNGSTWMKQESGTTIDLRDVWGSADGKTVFTCGSSFDNLHSVLLKYENNQWKTIWQRDGTGSVAPYGFNVASIWSKKQATYITSSNGVFRMQDSIPVKVSNNFSDFSKSLRGNSEYDMLTVGNGGRIWHYNGVGWKAIADSSENHLLNACGLNGNTAVIVGTDYSIGFGAGLIRMGKRLD